MSVLACACGRVRVGVCDFVLFFSLSLFFAAVFILCQENDLFNI